MSIHSYDIVELIVSAVHENEIYRMNVLSSNNIFTPLLSLQLLTVTGAFSNATFELGVMIPWSFLFAKMGSLIAYLIYDKYTQQGGAINWSYAEIFKIEILKIFH